MPITNYFTKTRVALTLILSALLGTAQADDKPIYKFTLAETWGQILPFLVTRQKTWRSWRLKCPMAAFKSVSIRLTSTRHH